MALSPRSAREEGAGTGRMETSSMRSPPGPGPPAKLSNPPVRRTNGPQPLGASGFPPGPAGSPPKVLKTLKSEKPSWPMSSVLRSIGSTGSPPPPSPGPPSLLTFQMTDEKSPFAVEKVPLPVRASVMVMEKFEKPDPAHSPE